MQPHRPPAGAQGAAHGARQHHGERTRSAATRTAHRLAPARRRLRRLGEGAEAAVLVVAAGQAREQPADAVGVAEVAEVIDPRAAVEAEARAAVGPAQAPGHRAGVDHEVVVGAVEPVGDEQLELLPHRVALGVAGDHAEVGRGDEVGVVQQPGQRRAGHHRLQPGQGTWVGALLDHREQEVEAVGEQAAAERAPGEEVEHRQPAVEAAGGERGAARRARGAHEAGDADLALDQQLDELGERLRGRRRRRGRAPSPPWATAVAGRAARRSCGRRRTACAGRRRRAGGGPPSHWPRQSSSPTRPPREWLTRCSSASCGRRRASASAFATGLSVRLRCSRAKARSPYAAARRVRAAAPAALPASHSLPKLPSQLEAVPCRKTSSGPPPGSFASAASGASAKPSPRLTRCRPGAKGLSWRASKCSPSLRAAPSLTRTPKNSSTRTPSPSRPRSAVAALAEGASASISQASPPSRARLRRPCSRTRASARVHSTKPLSSSTRTTSSPATSSSPLTPSRARPGISVRRAVTVTSVVGGRGLGCSRCDWARGRCCRAGGNAGCSWGFSAGRPDCGHGRARLDSG